LTEGVGTSEEARPRPWILIAEDHPSERTALRGVLEEAGLTVLGVAADGASVVDMAEWLGPDVILMDLRMPGMNGLEAAARIRTTSPLTQVVIHTAYEEALLLDTGDGDDVYAYLVKGCPADMIIDVVRRAWEYRQGMVARGRAAGSFPDLP
jgi:DNA-binding NarL/FixJ family response regulator